MKPINDLAFKNICENFSNSCINFCSEATYTTMQVIAHRCDPSEVEEDPNTYPVDSSNFIGDEVLVFYELIMSKDSFHEEFIDEFLYPAILDRWSLQKSKKEIDPTIEAPKALSYFTSYDFDDFDEIFDSFVNDIDYDFLTNNLKRCWDRACITDKPFPLEELIKMLASDRIGTSEFI